MLSYLEHEWRVMHTESFFEAHVGTDDRRPEDVRWYLNLKYVAGGPQWRRVADYKRPDVDLSVGPFHLPEGRWQGLEELNFWDNSEQEKSLLGWLGWQGGMLDVSYKAGIGTKLDQNHRNSCQWRVVERTGAHFTVELAAFASGGPLEKVEEEVLVLPDGTEERVEKREEDFWKQNAGLYAVETVRFGHVWVSVPINVRDVETYARARVAELLGVRRAPESVLLMDSRGQDVMEECKNELTLRMDFNGRFGIL
jgi:hypothetical protein